MYLDINSLDTTRTGSIELFHSSGSELQAQPSDWTAPHIGESRNTAELIEHRAPYDPVLCFSVENLRTQTRRFQREFPGHVTYAVKANHSGRVLTTLSGLGIETFDVASLQEMELVRSRAPNAQFHYHNPVKSRREISEAYNRFGVRQFAVDDEVELAKLLDICEPRETTLAVRFRLEGTAAVHDFSTKFGATPPQAILLLKAASEAGFSCALTFHPGSQCYDPVAYTRHIHSAAEIARDADVELVSLNVGGGFPATYENDNLPGLEAYFTAISNAAEEAFGGSAPLLECEPGRALVASCMSLLVPVKHVRQEHRELFLQDGIYGTLMEFSQTSLRPAVTWHRTGGGRIGEKTDTFEVYGPTCDPMDRLPGRYVLPADLQEGDYLEFASMGAYSIATATRFNGYGDVRIIPVQDIFTG